MFTQCNFFSLNGVLQNREIHIVTKSYKAVNLKNLMKKPNHRSYIPYEYHLYKAKKQKVNSVLFRYTCDKKNILSKRMIKNKIQNCSCGSKMEGYTERA